MSIDKSALPTISEKLVFPDNLIKHAFIDKADGMYVVLSPFTKRSDIVHIKDSKLVQYDKYFNR